MSKILFILKHRDALYSDENYSKGGLSSGLLNSASFVIDMLNEINIECKLVQVIDNNCIDKEVTLYKPTHVVCEAYWVVPEKFAILTKLHPDVEWIIRNHSEMPFLANEGMAINWTLEYLKYPNVFVSANSDRALLDMITMAKAAYNEDVAKNVLYLPNYYTFAEAGEIEFEKNCNTLDIGCFGAIRPLKNQLLQAIAAIELARVEGKNLRFHINYSRIEGGGNNPLKNIEALFDHMGPQFQLVKHTWMPHDKFLEICAKMDLAMCVSFTETFCIVAADMVSLNVPIIVSPDIRWATYLSKADPTSSVDMVRKMQIALRLRRTGILQLLNKYGLRKNINAAKEVWKQLFE